MCSALSTVLGYTALANLLIGEKSSLKFDPAEPYEACSEWLDCCPRDGCPIAEVLVQSYLVTYATSSRTTLPRADGA